MINQAWKRWFLLILALAQTLVAGEWQGRPDFAKAVFGGTTMTVPMSSIDPTVATVAWRLAVNQRVLTRGAAPVKNGQAELLINVPPVKNGNIWKTELFAQTTKGSTEQVMTVWIFPDNPFAERDAWLQSLDLQLFDPTEQVKSKLEALGVPFHVLLRPDQMSDLRNSLILVGPGVSPSEWLSLRAGLALATANGCSVIWESPGDGELPLWNVRAIKSLNLHDASIIQELDPRFAALTPRGTMTLTLRDGRQPSSRAEMAPWPWVEVVWNSRGCLIWYDFSLFTPESWITEPTRRWLLASLFDRCIPDPNKSPSIHDWKGTDP